MYKLAIGAHKLYSSLAYTSTVVVKLYTGGHHLHIILLQATFGTIQTSSYTGIAGIYTALVFIVLHSKWIKHI